MVEIKIFTVEQASSTEHLVVTVYNLVQAPCDDDESDNSLSQRIISISVDFIVNEQHVA